MVGSEQAPSTGTSSSNFSTGPPVPCQVHSLGLYESRGESTATAQRDSREERVGLLSPEKRQGDGLGTCCSSSLGAVLLLDDSSSWGRRETEAERIKPFAKSHSVSGQEGRRSAHPPREPTGVSSSPGTGHQGDREVLSREVLAPWPP